MKFSIEGGKTMVPSPDTLAISRGEFVLKNKEEFPVEVSLLEIYVKNRNLNQLIENPFIFNTNEEKEINSKEFLVEGTSELKIIVGFPKVLIQGSLDSPIIVEALFLVKEEKKKAVSTVEFIRRIPQK